VTDLFWLFFIFSALQPVLRQSMLDAMRMRKIAPLERTRNSRVILLVHRQEMMQLLGFLWCATSTSTIPSRCCARFR
jgi:ClpP class serine protease